MNTQKDMHAILCHTRYFKTLLQLEPIMVVVLLTEEVGTVMPTSCTKFVGM